MISVWAKADAKKFIPKLDLFVKHYQVFEKKSDPFLDISICRFESCKTFLINTLNEKAGADVVTSYVFHLKQVPKWDENPSVINYVKKLYDSSKCKVDSDCLFKFMKKNTM